MQKSPPLPVARSRVETTHIVLPGDANDLGTAFGGKVMQWMDLTAAVAARRHCGVVAVTAAVDSLLFVRPVRLGDVLIMRASVNRSWRSSMEVGVRVDCETTRESAPFHASSAYLTFVAVNDKGQHREVPPVLPESAEERRRFEQAEIRRKHRLARRSGQQDGAISSVSERIMQRMAHDIKNPLSVVQSNLRFLLMEVEKEEWLEVLRESLASARRANRVLDNTLSTTQMQALAPEHELEAVSLPELEPLLQEAREFYGGQRSLRIILPEVEVMTNRRLLSRLLVAILEHALRHTPVKNEVVIEGQVRKEGDLVLQIIDGGESFPPHFPPSIVARSIPQAEQAATGFRSDRGLELIFAGHAARALGLQVDLLSRTDGKRGVVFQLTFPRWTSMGEASERKA